MAGAALALATVLLARGIGLDAPLWLLAGLIVVAFFAERQSVRVTSHTQSSVSVVPILFTAVLFGPLAGMVVGGCALMADFGRPHIRWVVWSCQRAISAGMAGIAAVWVLHGQTGFGRIFAAVAAASITEAVVDGGFTSLTAGIRGNGFG